VRFGWCVLGLRSRLLGGGRPVLVCVSRGQVKGEGRNIRLRIFGRDLGGVWRIRGPGLRGRRLLLFGLLGCILIRRAAGVS